MRDPLVAERAPILARGRGPAGLGPDPQRGHDRRQPGQRLAGRRPDQPAAAARRAARARLGGGTTHGRRGGVLHRARERRCCGRTNCWSRSGSTFPPPERVFRFEKAGTRPAMECSVVTVGLAFTPREGRFERRPGRLRLVGADAAARPQDARRALEGQPRRRRDDRSRGRAAAEAEVSPISDIRGSEALPPRRWPASS